MVQDPTVLDLVTFLQKMDLIHMFEGDFIIEITNQNVDILATRIKANKHVTSVKVIGSWIPDQSQPSHEFRQLIDAFEGKTQIEQFVISGAFQAETFLRIISVVTTLSLVELIIDSADDYGPQQIEHLSMLFSITNLTSLQIWGMEPEYTIPFLNGMIKFVQILYVSDAVTSQTGFTEALADLLTADNPLQILNFESFSELDPLGRVLELNSNLKSLTIECSEQTWFIRVFEGLTVNTGLLKFRGRCNDRDLPSLIKMLKTNTVLEDLDLMLYSNMDEPRPLISALAASSIINLSLDLFRVSDLSRFAKILFQALRSNTTLKRLTLESESIKDMAVEAEDVIQLLLLNTTLEVFDIEFLTINNFERLDVVTTNMTLTKVNRNAPLNLRKIAMRNRENRKQRAATLLSLTMNS